MTVRPGFLARCNERTRPCYILHLLLTSVAEAHTCVPEQLRFLNAVGTPVGDLPLMCMQSLALCYPVSQQTFSS